MAEIGYKEINHGDEKGIELDNGDKVSITIPQENHQQHVTVVLDGIRLEIEPDTDGGLMITSDKGEKSWIRG